MLPAFSGEHLHYFGHSSVAGALDHLALTLDPDLEFESSQFRAQLRQCWRQCRVLRPTGAQPDLTRRIRLEHEHAAGSEPSNSTAIDVGSQRPRDVQEDRNDRLPCARRDLEFGKVGDDGLNRDTSLGRQPSRFCQANGGLIDRGDRVTAPREKNGVAALALCQAQHRARRQPIRHLDEKIVGLGPKDILRAIEPGIPALAGRQFVRWCAHRRVVYSGATNDRRIRSRAIAKNAATTDNVPNESVGIEFGKALAMFLRISRGHFAADRYQEIADRLRSAEVVLAPVIRELPGLIDYYAGLDRETNSMIRVSVWDTQEHAAAMANVKIVAEKRAEFEAAGVTWEPIVTYSVSWWVQST